MKPWTLLKSLFAIATLVLLGMLYWSTTLIEHDLKLLQRQVAQLRHVQHASRVTNTSETHTYDTRYTNLLEEDEYFTKTLPEMVGQNFEPTGCLRQATIGHPQNLHPFNPFREVSSMYGMCTVRVGDLKFGQYETLAPDMGVRLEERDNEYWVHLRRDVFWQPLNPDHFPASLALDSFFLRKHPVTAHDFKFYFDAVMNPYISEGKAAALRTYFSDIEEFRVIDDYTFAVRWKAHKTPEDTEKVKYTSLSLTAALQPLPCFVYQYFADGQKIIDGEEDYKTNSIWAQNFSHHWAKNVIVSCGAYIFDKMDEEGIRFRRNPDHYNPYAALVSGVHYRFKESFDAVWQDFKVGNIDLCSLSPNQLIEYDTFMASSEYAKQEKAGQRIESIDYVDLSFYYIGWNSVKPFFANDRLRQAMTLAIDRRRIIEQNLNDMAVVTTGPLARFSPSYDDQITPWPYNPEEAKEILASQGWVDLDGDGIRDKIIDGQKVAFRFTLYYFVKSLSSKVIVEYISTALREIGVDVNLRGVDIADLSRQFEDKSFDAICMGWKLGTPPEDPRQLWHSSGAKEKGSSNAIGFSNPEVDQIIESLNYEYNKEKRVSLYHAFHRIIHREAPYTFLYTPKVRLLYRSRVKNIFIPRERQDLIPGADIPEPNTQVLWLAT